MQFEDKNAKKWTFEIDIPQTDVIQRALGVDLLDPRASFQQITQLYNSSRAAFDLVWLLIQQDAKASGYGSKSMFMLECVDIETLSRIRDGVETEVANFIQRLDTKVSVMIQAEKEFAQKAMDKAKAVAASGDVNAAKSLLPTATSSTNGLDSFDSTTTAQE